MTPRELATELHDKMCTYNHTDGCGWEYESWDPNHPQGRHTRLAWLAKAKRLLKFLPAEDVLAFATELKRR